MERWGEEPVLTRGRAAARLRAREGLASAERRAVREARGEIGAAVRRVRAVRARPVTRRLTAPAVELSSRHRLRRFAPAFIVAAAAAAILLSLGGTEPATADAGGRPPDEVAAPAAPARENASSRGRSVEGVAFVAVAEPTPEPTPQPPASPTPAPAPVAAATARASAAPRASASPGTGTGGGITTGAGAGGNGRGTSPAPTATPLPPAPTPTLRPTPSPVPTRPADMARFTGRVVDSRTSRPIEGACIIVGVRACNERDVYTDATGRFTIDLPLGSNWDVNFGKTGYATGYRRLVSLSARTTDVGTIRLTARP